MFQFRSEHFEVFILVRLSFKFSSQSWGLGSLRGLEMMVSVPCLAFLAKRDHSLMGLALWNLVLRVVLLNWLWSLVLLLWVLDILYRLIGLLYGFNISWRGLVSSHDSPCGYLLFFGYTVEHFWALQINLKCFSSTQLVLCQFGRNLYWYQTVVVNRLGGGITWIYS